MIGARPLIGVAALGLGLGLLLGPSACSDVPSSCHTVCSALSRCRMLPGPLGDEQSGRSDVEDCEARCSVSSQRSMLYGCVHEMMQSASTSSSAQGSLDTSGSSGATSCSASGGTSDTGESIVLVESTDWCDHGFCSEFASCLRSSLENDTILGVGSVEISASQSTPIEQPMACPAEVPRPADQSFLRDLCAPHSVLQFRDPRADEESMDPYVVQPGHVILELVSDQVESITVVEGDCDALQARLVVPNVPVGTYQASARVYAAESNNCVLFSGPVVQVKAGQTTNAAYWLECDAICEETPDANIDRPLCESHMPTALPTLCPEVEDYRCRDGEDNDGDDLIDCEDLDCEASGACDGTLTAGMSTAAASSESTGSASTGSESTGSESTDTSTDTAGSSSG